LEIQQRSYLIKNPNGRILYDIPRYRESLALASSEGNATRPNYRILTFLAISRSLAQIV
jgi:hypothetical protein